MIRLNRRQKRLLAAIQKAPHAAAISIAIGAARPEDRQAVAEWLTARRLPKDGGS